MMRLARIGAPGLERPIAIDDNGGAHDLTPLATDIDGAFLASAGISRARHALSELPTIEVRGHRVGAPVARPHAVWCVGMNYAAHAAESDTEPPSAPIVFLKTPNCIVGPNDDILLPRKYAARSSAIRTDWEVELAVVIGTRASYLESPELALAHVAGYTVANDVSERDYQLAESGGQWSKGKCCATFNPLGPWLIPATDIDHANLRLRSWVNGEARQDSSTSDMIFDVPTLVWHISQFATLEPGDVINTGTPNGVALSGRFPYLKVGDVVELEIETLGRQRQRVAT